MSEVCALIPAAGRGVRFGSSENKVFAPILGRPLLGWTLQAFADCDAISSIVLIGNNNDLPRLRAIGGQYGGGKIHAVVEGGTDRQSSVRLGLAACPKDPHRVIIHDAARPCVTPAIIARVLAATENVLGAATAAIPVSDTLVTGRGYSHAPTLDGIGHIGDSVSREGVWAIQTPQAFPLARLRDAHAKAETDGFQATDDMSVIRYGEGGGSGYLVPGSPENLKVTRPEDIDLAEAILMRRHTPRSAPPFRIGYGYDVHPFADGRPMYLGGVHFPESERGLQGHSDADALLHAVCDALLGAAGMGDIGKHFPPSDDRHKDRRSTEFLQEVGEAISEAGYEVGNMDVMVLAETPRIGPRVEEIKEIISQTLGIEPERVSIKATTNEGLGFIGRGEGIAVHATALLMAVR